MSEKKFQFREVAVPQSKDVPRDVSRDVPKDGAARGDIAAAKPKRIPSPGEEVAVPPQLDPRAAAKDLPPERGGYDGPEPTRFGDWEHKGRTTDF